MDIESLNVMKYESWVVRSPSFYYVSTMVNYEERSRFSQDLCVLFHLECSHLNSYIYILFTSCPPDWWNSLPAANFLTPFYHSVPPHSSVYP
jgi:hypothetical protein